MMKKKFNFALLSFLPVTFAWPFFLISNNNSNFESKSLAVHKNAAVIDLATNPLVNNTVTKYQSGRLYAPVKTLVDGQVASEIYNQNSVTSIHSINTVRNENYFFNFINDLNRGGLINIVATPINPNLQQRLILKTNFTSIEDAAIVVDKDLILVATDANGKYVVNYRIETMTNINNEIETSIDEKTRLNVPNFAIEMNNNKYALSPYARNFEGMSYTSVLLWPMGMTIGELKEHQAELLRELQINNLGKMTINSVSADFVPPSSINPLLEIVSLSPLQSISAQGLVVDTNFFGFTAPTNSTNDAIQVFQLSQDLQVETPFFTAYDFRDPKAAIPPAPAPQLHPFFPGNIARAPLTSIVPYAMPRVDANGNFSFFWISQNGADRTATGAAFIPEALIQLRVKIDESNQIVGLNSDSAINILFRERTDEGASYPIISDASMIEQIHYATGSIFGDSFIATRSIYAFSGSNRSFTGALPVKINQAEFEDYSQVMIDWWNRQMASTSLTGVSEVPNRSDINVMATINNGVVYRTGMDFHRGDSVIIKTPPIEISSTSINLNQSTYNTYLPNNLIYLPAKPSSDPNDPFEGLPVKIQELDFSPNRIPYSKLPAANSIMYYVPYFIDNLQSEYLDYSDLSDYLVLVETPIFRDLYGQILPIKDFVLDNNGNQVLVPPVGAESVEISVTIPYPYVNGGIVFGQPLTVNLTFVNNPGIPSNSGDEVIKLNPTNLAGSPTEAVNVLETFNTTKTIPRNQSIIGINNQALIQINPFYLESAFQDVTFSGDDFLGTLNANFKFRDANGNFYEKNFAIGGFQANYILIPSVITPVVVIAIVVLIVVIILIRKNQVNKKKSMKAGFVLAKKMGSELKYDIGSINQEPKNLGDANQTKFPTKPNPPTFPQRQQSSNNNQGISPPERPGTKNLGNASQAKFPAKPNPPTFPQRQQSSNNNQGISSLEKQKPK